MSSLAGRHFITEQEWTKDEVDRALDLSYDLKDKFKKRVPTRFLPDQTVFMIFFEQSTRTRNSMEAGITQLGGHAHDLTADKMQLSHGESPKDTAVVLSRMGHAIACRNCFYGIGNKYLREMEKWSSIPILNLQDDYYHPMQGFADLMVMQEKFGRNLKGLKVCISWAYATSHAKPLSVPQTQIMLFTRYGMDVTVVAPNEFPLMPGLVETAKKNAKENGGSLRFVDNMDAGFEGAQIVIPKNWGGFAHFKDYKDDDEHKKAMRANLEKHKDWICDVRRMKLAAKDVKYMHAMPADRGREVTDEVIDNDNWSIIYDEAENRLHTAKAVMALTMGGVK